MSAAARKAARMHDTLEQAEYKYRQGYIDEPTWRWSVFLWTWSASRFAGAAGLAHDRAYHQLGPQLYARRIQRVRAMLQRLQA